MLNSKPIKKQQGVALVLCLVLASVFAAISIYTSEKERQQLQIFMGLQEKVELHNLAHTIAQKLHYAILTNQQFVWQGKSHKLNGYGEELVLPLDNSEVGQIKMVIQDTSGLLALTSPNLNNFTNLIDELQQDTGYGQKFIDAWFDWEDKDSLARINGKEADTYDDPPYLPRNDKVQLLSEFKLIHHMTPELFRKLEPHLTYFSRLRFDPKRASDEMRRLLSLRELSSIERNSAYSTLVNGLVVEQFQSFKVRLDIQGEHARFQRQYVINYRPNDVRLVSISEFGD